MEQFSINCCGAQCNISTDKKIKFFFEKNKDFIVFQNLKIDNFDENIEYNLIYKNCLKGEECINCDEKTIYIRYPQEMLDEQNIAYASRYLIERQFAQNGMFTCHSACVEKDGKAILLLGDAGAGKTSVAVNLCVNHGFNLISNDQTVIGVDENQIIAYGGTKFINLRLLSVKQNMPFLLKIFNDKNVDEWSYKKSVLARDLDITEQYDPTNIEQIIVLHCNNNYNNTIISPGDTWRNNFTLYQNLTFNISSCSSPIVDKNGHPIGFVPSYDTRETFINRKNLIKLINENPLYKNITGNIEDIQEEIIKNHLEHKNKIMKLENKGRNFK